LQNDLTRGKKRVEEYVIHNANQSEEYFGEKPQKKKTKVGASGER